ncbi:SymE family type I addiction module toxin [Klebsiella electrica]|uniref:SymE family type I addiction module toxin n=1 Tax=Klebsiella electrica TaxID=1259973 RepID=A0AAJ5UCV5_9ENTR|nr:SymE family type I addiction module toxin [Klebsiella electrica]WBW59210.1 SymE family type I addiction module toxin [Klebsiella electrica]
MAEQNFKPESAIAKMESDESETSSENCELVRKKSANRSQRKSTTATSQPLARTEFYDRMRHDYIPLQGDWLSLAGFTPGMPVKIRVMPDCIVITTQNTRELYGCAEGLSVTYVNRQKMKLWLEGFPGGLNDTGDLPVYRREDGHCG